LSSQPHRIDVHHHYTSPEWLASLKKHHEQSYKFPGVATLNKWSPAAAIEAMDEGGVQTSVLSTCTPGIWFGDPVETRRMARNMNDFGADLVREYKGRYGLFGVLPLPEIDSSLDEIAYVMDTLNADGISVLSSYGDKWLGDPSFAPVWDELNRRKAVVYSHATAPDCCKTVMPNFDPTTIEFNTDTARTIINLIETGSAERYPDIRFIFSHAGGTISALAGRYLGEQVATKTLNSEVAPNTKLGYLRRFHYDTAASANFVSMQAMKMIVPSSQILLGTDFPWFRPAKILEGLSDAGLTQADLAGIERENATRLMPQFSKGR
jgi:predicted TIM-barrel fold metal-dependent hydrolase